MSPLALRIVTGVVLIAVALAAVHAGGTAFLALVAAAALLMLAEWCVMHRIGRVARLGGLAIVALVCGLGTGGMQPGMTWSPFPRGWPLPATTVAVSGLFVLLLGTAVLWLAYRWTDRRRAGRLAFGMIYCGLPAMALLWLRGNVDGLPLTITVFALVWTTDIGAFFTGRAIGGAKLAPAISPNKTWAGAVGGVIAAVVIGVLLSQWLPSPLTVPLPRAIAVSMVLAVAAVLGDLFESWLKRRAGVKDSGALLPGHGGVMDRLDGLVPVAVVAALFVAAAR